MKHRTSLMVPIMSLIGLLAVCSVSTASDWERSDRGRDPVLNEYGVHYESSQESFVVSIFCAPAPYATIEIGKLKKKDSIFLKDARKAKALHTIIHRGDRALLDLPMPYRSEIAFPDSLNLDGTGDFMLDLLLHETLNIEIPVAPEKTLSGTLDGHGLLKLLKDDAKCDVEGIEKVLEHRKGILEGEIVVDENAPIAVHGVDDVTDPILLKKTRPDFPSTARIFGTNGIVILKVLVRKDGSLEAVKITSCKPPDLGFEESAVNHVQKSRYRPARKDGIPVDVWFNIQIDYKLER